MPITERIIAGDNIHLERKHNDIVIHCSHIPAPQNNLHSGFFQLKSTPEKDSPLGVTISNCIFKLNGKYVKLDDYKINTYYGKHNLFFLYIGKDPDECRIEYYVYHKDDEVNLQLDKSNMILLYDLVISNSRLHVESFAARGLIDTIYPGEGFLYTLQDGSIKTTVTRTGYGDKNEFTLQGAKFYIPSFNPATGEALNIVLSSEKGGAIAVNKEDEYYIWQTTGFPSSWSESYTVKINPEKIYF